MASGFYLTLLIGAVVPIPAPRAVLDALTEVEVTRATEEPGGFRLSFTLSNRSPLHTVFLVTAAQTPLLRLIIVVTINGVPHVLADGVTTNCEVSSGGQPGQSTLSIIGEDLTKLMDLVEFSGLPYPAMPAEARVALILAKYAAFGVVPLVIPSLFPDVPLPVDEIPKHEGTDLAYVNQLAEDAGYVFYITPGPAPGMNVAYWGPPIKVGVPQPALNLDMDAHTNVESLSFNYRTAETTLPVVYVQNRESRIPIPIPIPNVNPLQPPLGLLPPLPTRVTFMHETANLSPMAAIARGLAEASRSADAVSGNGSLNVVRYGRLLTARQLVGVRGAGVAYDGLYYVSRVTSTIKRGEFKQSFELTRNGLVSITPVVPP
jgi:hypothetical protein